MNNWACGSPSSNLGGTINDVFELTVSYSCDVSLSFARFSLRSTQTLDVNVTEALLARVGSAIASFQDLHSLRGSGSPSRNSFVFRVRNDTGRRIRVWSMEEELSCIRSNGNRLEEKESETQQSKTKAAGIVDNGCHRELQLRQSTAGLSSHARLQSLYRSPGVVIKVRCML